MDKLRKTMSKKRLVELLKHKYDHFCDQCGINKQSDYIENLADYLLANGVIVPPLMMAEVVYMIIDNDVVKYHITKIEQNNDYSFMFGAYPCENIKPFTKTKYFKENTIGKTVFQDHSEAVKKVKGEDYYE